MIRCFEAEVLQRAMRSHDMYMMTFISNFPGKAWLPADADKVLVLSMERVLPRVESEEGDAETEIRLREEVNALPISPLRDDLCALIRIIDRQRKIVHRSGV